MSSLFRFFALLAVLFILAIAMHFYEKKRGKRFEFIHKSWYQWTGVLVGLLLMGYWSHLEQSGAVHELSQDIAQVIVRIIQKIARFIGFR